MNPAVDLAWEYAKPVLRLLFKLFLVFLLIFSVAVISANLDGRPLFVAFTSGYSMYPYLKPGELVFIVPEPFAGKVTPGNIIVFHDPDYGKIPGYPPYIIHQVVNSTSKGFITKGINDDYVDQIYMPPVNSSEIYGKLLVLNGNPVIVPGIGSIVYFLENNSLEGVIILTLIGISFLVLDTSTKSRQRRQLRISTRGIMLGIGVVIISFTIIASLAMSFSATFSYFTSNTPVEIGGGALNTPSIDLGVIMHSHSSSYVVNVTNRLLIPEYVEVSSVRGSSSAYYNITPTNTILMPSQTLHLKFTAIGNGSQGLKLVVVKAFVIPTLFPITPLAQGLKYYPLELLLISSIISTLPFIMFIYIVRLKSDDW
ncbi:signal peptidase I [Metallosphaera javensis (ex Sakai et al. 2022)]|uniref:signal peptidase I n=1 Tax=Metallosphaera javensis (ex Sakai et al. 2022) TaxID=2775498 RepID=UPI002585D17C|nr:MAG: S26 family signal peptidase [Metallosphaera javensis (ex Sakai et al. 2022)]